MPIITISRGTKSGGMALAEALAKRLDCPCLSREILLESARRYNIDEATLQAELSRPPSLWQRLAKERHRYLIFVRCSLLQAATQGDFVYHGHAGQIFLEGIRHVLKVRIEAPFERRVRALMQERQLDHDAAVAQIERVDAGRRRWVSFLYGKEWDDPAFYDIIINLANISIESACDIVAHMAERSDFQPTDASLERLIDMSLECEVLAGLAADDKLWDQDLTVSARHGAVTVRGCVKNQKHRKLVEQIVPQVKGVQTCDIDVNLRSDPPLTGSHWRD
jgi:cytidylate kinase